MTMKGRLEGEHEMEAFGCTSIMWGAKYDDRAAVKKEMQNNQRLLGSA